MADGTGLNYSSFGLRFENPRFSTQRSFPLTENSRFPTLSRSSPDSHKIKKGAHFIDLFFNSCGPDGTRTRDFLRDREAL